MLKQMFAAMAIGALAAGCTTDKVLDLEIYKESAPVAGAAALHGKYDVKASPYFKSYDFYNARPTRSLVILPKFATLQQSTDITAGPTAVKMVLDYFGRGKNVTERQLAKEMNVRDEEHPRSDGGIGATTEAVEKALQNHNVATYSNATFETEADFAAFLKQEISAGNPVLLCYSTWGAHWVVAIGYDSMGTKDPIDDVIIIADPYDIGDHKQDGYGIVSLPRLFWNWYDPGVMYGEPAFEQYVVAKRPAK